MTFIYGTVSVFLKGQYDHLVDQFMFGPLSLERIKSICSPSLEELLDGVLITKPTEMARIQQYAPMQIEPNSYDYLLTCYESEPSWVHQAIGLLL